MILKLLNLSKRLNIFVLGICLGGLGLWQFYRYDISSTELLGPSFFDFTKSNHPQSEFIFENKETAEINKPSENKKNLEKSETSLTRSLEVLSTEDTQKFKIVEDILKSRNDNDPRIDQDLKKIDPLLKLALQQKYAQLPEENRNQRGLLLYLVTREIYSEKDLAFIKTVYEEPPCMSLSDCRSSSDFDPHMDSVNQVTLDYPQKVGLYQLEKNLGEKPQLLSDPVFKKVAIELLQSAERFPVPSIQKQAQKIRLKYNL